MTTMAAPMGQRTQVAIALLVLVGIQSVYSADLEPLADESELRLGAAFVDAFYSFDEDRLAQVMINAQDAWPYLRFYQGWAEGGNYKVLERHPCELVESGRLNCPVTVKDDLLAALEIDFNVTDTFELTISGGTIVNVTTRSNDPPEVYAAFEWVWEHRSGRVDLPCDGFFDGGKTPKACATVVIEAFREYAQLSN